MAPSDDNGELSAVPVAIPGNVAGGTYHVGGVGASSGAFATTTVEVTPQLTASPARGAANWNVKLRGAGFAAGQTVDILWDCDGNACADAPAVATVTADDHGGFDGTSIKVPASARPGPHRIGARPVGGKEIAFGAFSVETVLDVSPKKGEAGWNATVRGTGFGPNEAITLAWDCNRPDCAANGKLRTAEADADGAFSVKLQIPQGAALGEHAFIAIGEESKASAASTFSVTGAGAAPAGEGGTGGAAPGGSGASGPGAGPDPSDDGTLPALLRILAVAAGVVAILAFAGFFVLRRRRSRASD
jgi:hypothetical protein